jgi:hypothetical protein
MSISNFRQATFVNDWSWPRSDVAIVSFSISARYVLPGKKSDSITPALVGALRAQVDASRQASGRA